MDTEEYDAAVFPFLIGKVLTGSVGLISRRAIYAEFPFLIGKVLTIKLLRY